MNAQCLICYFPTINTCGIQHSCCEFCLSQILINNAKQHCPCCREAFNKTPIKQMIFFQQWLAQKDRIKQLQAQNQQLKLQLQTARLQFKQVISTRRFCSDLIDLKKIKDKLMASNNYDLSPIIIKSLIEKYPNSVDKFIGLGSMEQVIGFSEKKGFQWYENRYKVTDLCLYDQLALMYMLQPNYKLQKQWYQKMIAKDPTNYKAMYGLALTQHTNLSLCEKLALKYMLDPDYIEQKAWYKKIIDKDSLNIKALYGLALTQHNHKNNQNALRLYQKIIQLKPDFDKPYQMIGFIYLSQQDFKNAKIFAKKCLSKNSNNIFAQYIIGISTQPKNHGLIRQKMNLVIAKQPKYVRALYQIGVSFYKQQQYQKAEQYFKQCYSINPNFIDSAFTLVQNYQIHNSISITRQLLEQLLQKRLSPYQRFTCYYNLGVMLSNQYKLSEKQNQRCSEQNRKAQYNYKDAQTYFSKCLQIKQFINNDNRQKIADSLYMLQKFETALPLYLICIRIDRNNVALMEKIVSCHQQMKNYPASLWWLDRWLTLSPTNGCVNKKYAQIYIKQQKFGQAISWCQKRIKQSYWRKEIYPFLIRALKGLSHFKKSQTINCIVFQNLPTDIKIIWGIVQLDEID